MSKRSHFGEENCKFFAEFEFSEDGRGHFASDSEPTRHVVDVGVSKELSSAVKD